MEASRLNSNFIDDSEEEHSLSKEFANIQLGILSPYLLYLLHLE